ncbi:unnamed protein product [Diatraea saccharalis]|uniref:DNA-directed RNA polymerase n=1 Tax=Diatraea saccharalis TaxID=40085 RepID=A0A9N9R2R4_9NEOP|nr:unnamed protein product [Diatraea saccharalis]
MHRLITARNIYHTSFHGITSVNNSIESFYLTKIQCSYCRSILLGQLNPEKNISVRHQSTRTASILKSLKKKAKHKTYRQYGELLAVGEKEMTETKVAINKLHAVHLSKLASSSISLGQLYQLTSKTIKESNISEVDTELLKTVRDKILKNNKPAAKEIILEYDDCALLYTSNKISGFEDTLKNKQYIEMIKESYYNFRRATIYDQRLQDLRYAISEGLSQEFDIEIPKANVKEELYKHNIPKSPRAVFRELFIDNNLDSYDQELMAHISTIQSHAITHPALDEMLDDSVLHNEISDIKEDHDAEENIEYVPEKNQVKSLKIKKAKETMKAKRKAMRDKRHALQELNMKHDIKELEQRGKQESLHKLLTAHLQLLCSLHMVQEARQILQYYRQKSFRGPDHPKVTDVTIYNILLHGYASMGQLENVKELLSFMTEGKVEPNEQSFAAIFECVERSELSDKVSILKFYRKLMQEKAITLNDILDRSKFLYDQREQVLKAVRRVEPGFEPQYTPPVLDYDCPLLEKLKLENVKARKGLFQSPAEGLLSVEETIQNGKEQLQIEIKGDIEVQNIIVKEDVIPESVKFCRKKLQETENEWRDVIKEAFIRNIGTLKSQSNASHSAITLYPYLKVLEVDQFVDIIMDEISKLVDGSETYSPTLKLLQREIGTQVYHRYQIEQYRRNGVLKKVEEIYEKYCQWFVQRSGTEERPYNARQAWLHLSHLHRDGASLDTVEAPWPMEMRQNIGKFLYNIIINDVKIDVNMFKSKPKQKKLPAVYKVHRPWGRLVRLELKPHPTLARLWTGAARPRLRMRAPLLPTRAPPAPWITHRAGAYLLTPTPLIRMPFNVSMQWKRLEESPPAALFPVLDSLNQLGEVPWRINQPVLDIQLKVFRSGGNKKLDIAPPASALDTSTFGAETDAAAVFKRRIAISRARAEMHSLWCDALYKLSLANHYRDCIFWLPHNMDFRGRVYACPPHVSALGADSARALLKFAKPQPLGPRGLRWLKLHAINLTGEFKRHTIQERLDHAEMIMDKILDSADRPLNGQGWWMKSEEPWQTLACCMEIANAVRSPNPEEYMCSFPVHQDGSCNGLQHYAALGGDQAGAVAVNLAPDDRPNDVYSAVAALVEEMRKRDAAAGIQPAIILENFVRRKVIKQTVMTTVYGVTKFGARLQIAKQLKDIDDFPKEHVWACSQYLTVKTFDSLREMFTSTKLIQDWFTDCAKLISGVCGESVEWVTPLGLRVVQPYYRRASPSHATCRAPLDQHQRPCTMKQRNAFPPNFIHSLDSSHMMLTGLHCQAEGLTFVSVHDCFWTHPNTVDIMNQICREEFVALHSQPILDDLSKFLTERYSYSTSEMEDQSIGAANKKRVNNMLQKVPEKGTFDLNSVLDSVYFFS